MKENLADKSEPKDKRQKVTLDEEKIGPGRRRPRSRGYHDSHHLEEDSSETGGIGQHSIDISRSAEDQANLDDLTSDDIT